MTLTQLKAIYAYEDVVEFSGFDLLCTHSEVGLEGSKLAIKRAGTGRGRAIGVIVRWTLTKKFEKLYLESKGNMEGRGAKWLRDVPPGCQEFPDAINDAIDHVEHIERVRDGYGGYQQVKRTWHMRCNGPEDTEEELRCVVSHVRSEHITGVISSRKQFFASMKEGGGLGVVQKILLIQALRDVTSLDGYEVAFRANTDDVHSKESEYTTEKLMDIPLMDTTGDDKDDENLAAFDELVKKWDRFHVTLKYWITVKPLDGRSTRRREARGLDDIEKTFIKELEKNNPGAVEQEVEEGVAYYKKEASLYITLYNAFMLKHREVDRQKVMKHFPVHTRSRVSKTRHVSMHEAALDALVLYTGNESRAEFLGSHTQSLRAVHIVTLAISGLYRMALGKDRCPLEEKARGCVGIVSLKKHEISILNGRKSQSVPAFTTGEEEKLFSLPYKVYAKEKMEEEYYAGKYAREGASRPAQRERRRQGNYVDNFNWSFNLDPPVNPPAPETPTAPTA